MTARRRVALMMHEGFHGPGGPVTQLLRACSTRGAELCVEAGGIESSLVDAQGVTVVEGLRGDPAVDLCVTLGGDGTILRALRAWSGTDVPVFAINFGQVGFLATAEPDDLTTTFGAALDGAFDRLHVPAVTVRTDGLDGPAPFGINDASLHRRPDTRVAELGYGVAGAVIGAVRCDGLVACTAAGSTGYNLANGGPILAWGVEGYGVTFIAPHSLTARAIVVSPNDALVVENRGRDPLDVLVDGRESGLHLAPGERAVLGYRRDAAVLAQLPGSSFYARLREKFGHLRG